MNTQQQSTVGRVVPGQANSPSQGTPQGPQGPDHPSPLRDQLRGVNYQEGHRLVSPLSAKQGLERPKLSPDLRRTPPRAKPPQMGAPPTSKDAKSPEQQAKPRRPAPLPPKARGPVPPQPTPDQEQEPPADTLELNAHTGERLAKGAQALGNIKSRVDEFAQDKKTKAQESNKKRPFLKKLLGTGKVAEEAHIPAYQAASKRLGEEQGLFQQDADRAAVKKEPAAPQMLDAAGQRAKIAAGAITGKVEREFVDQVGDVAVGVASGDKAMMEQVLARGEDVLHSKAFANAKLLGSGAEGLALRGDYLGAFPMVAKVSKSSDPDMQAKVQDEGKAMASCDSPNVLKAYGSFAWGTSVGYMMELAAQGDMTKLQKRLAKLTLAERLEVMPHLMRGGFKGLLRVHANGKIHGDIKNDNIVIDEDLEPKLMDFGMVQDINEKDKLGTGTATHMAPEVVQGKIDRGSDVWSMGETLLLALFDLNSMAFARGQSKMGETFNEHLVKGDMLRDGNWLKKVEAKVQTLPPDKAKDGAVLMDFLRKVMEFDPARRITAKDALQHEFLALKNAKVGKQKLRGVVPKAKGKPVTA
jgi:hypothetical protein